MIRFTLVLMLVSGTAYAQSSGAQAESLFRQGREQMAAGKTAEACTSFEASQKLDPQITTLLNLAGCREKNGQFASAWGLFLDAERQTRSASDAATKQLHDVAKTRSAKLEARVSKLTINVPASNNVDGLVIMRGKDPVDSMMWNRALPIDGGTYTISVKAPGTTAWTTTVTVGAESDTKTVDVPDLKTLPRDVTPVKIETTPTVTQVEHDEVPETHARPSKVVPIAVGVGGVALLGGALTFELLGRANYDDAKAEMMDQSKRDSLYDSANTKRYVAQGLAVGGVACVGVAVWLYLRNDSGSATTTASKQLVVSPNGIALMGAF